MGACQFHKCLIASRFIHVKRGRGGKKKKRELKQYKICLEPPNLIYTTNRERSEERAKNGGEEERGGGSEREKRRGRKMLIGYSWACLA